MLYDLYNYCSNNIKWYFKREVYNLKMFDLSQQNLLIYNIVNSINKNVSHFSIVDTLRIQFEIERDLFTNYGCKGVLLRTTISKGSVKHCIFQGSCFYTTRHRRLKIRTILLTRFFYSTQLMHLLCTKTL